MPTFNGQRYPFSVCFKIDINVYIYQITQFVDVPIRLKYVCFQLRFTVENIYFQLILRFEAKFSIFIHKFMIDLRGSSCM